MIQRGAPLAPYTPPDTHELDKGHVRTALDFLVSIEPDPPPKSREEYEAATRLSREQVAVAMATLRKFAQQTQPMTLDQMQADFYGFTNDPRYLVSSNVSAVVRGCLNEAWDGVGPWRR